MDHENNNIGQLIRDVKMESTFAAKRKPSKSIDIEVALAYAFGDISCRQLMEITRRLGKPLSVSSVPHTVGYRIMKALRDGEIRIEGRK